LVGDDAAYLDFVIHVEPEGLPHGPLDIAGVGRERMLRERAYATQRNAAMAMSVDWWASKCFGRGLVAMGHMLDARFEREWRQWKKY
jgi:predicted alpha/beta hydrolase